MSEGPGSNVGHEELSVPTNMSEVPVSNVGNEELSVPTGLGI